jgi:hypothetical protein
MSQCRAINKCRNYLDLFGYLSSRDCQQIRRKEGYVIQSPRFIITYLSMYDGELVYAAFRNISGPCSVDVATVVAGLKKQS